MWSLINGAADLAAQYPVLAILIAFAAAIIEAVAVLGGTGSRHADPDGRGRGWRNGRYVHDTDHDRCHRRRGDRRFRFLLAGSSLPLPAARHVAVRHQADADGPRRELLPSLRHGERGDLPFRAGAAVHRTAGRRHGGHDAFTVSACQCEFGVCLGAGARCAGAICRNVTGGSADRRLAECRIVRGWVGAVHDRRAGFCIVTCWRVR